MGGREGSGDKVKMGITKGFDKCVCPLGGGNRLLLTSKSHAPIPHIPRTRGGGAKH